MLISFSVSNFKSILEPVTLNMLSNPDDHTNTDSAQIDYKNTKFNSVAMIYGANGSGKSSLIDAFNFVRMFFLGRHWDYIPRNRRAKQDIPSVFKVAYLSQDVPNEYTMTVNPDGTIHEHIEIFDCGIWKTYYDEDVPKDSNYKGINELNIDPRWERLDPWPGEEILELQKFFKTTVVFNSIDDDSELQIFNDPWLMKRIAESDQANRSLLFVESNYLPFTKYKKDYINFLQAIGIDVVGLEFECIGYKDVFEEFEDEQRMCLDRELPSSDFYDEIIEQIEEESKEFDYKDWEGDCIAPSDSFDIYQLKALVYDGFSVPVDEESAGTKRLLKMVNMFVSRIRCDNFTIFIDEIDAGLHDTLIKEIVNQFNLLKGADSKSQLIATTHSTELMRSMAFRRDQLWFFEMKSDRTSDLFSLAELSGVKATEDFAENYLCGRYGALPKVPSWAKDVQDE